MTKNKIIHLEHFTSDVNYSQTYFFHFCSTASSTKYSTYHDEQNRQFIIQLDPKDNTKIANLTYQFEEGTGTPKFANLMSTNVPKEFEGRGIAKILAIAAFEHFSSIQTPMKLTCWYLDGYIKRNPNSKYSDLVLKQS